MNTRIYCGRTVVCRFVRSTETEKPQALILVLIYFINAHKDICACNNAYTEPLKNGQFAKSFKVCIMCLKFNININFIEINIKLNEYIKIRAISSIWV